MKLEIEGRTRNETVCCGIVECQGNIVNLGSNVRVLAAEVGRADYQKCQGKSIDGWICSAKQRKGLARCRQNGSQ